MGTSVEQRKEKITRLKRSKAGDYVAEIFFDELQFVLNEDLLEHIIVVCHGMNTRVKSKDVLNVSLRYFPTTSSHKEFVTLHLARNSMYHRLPEFLFHPLVISMPGMSNKEIVDAIRANKKQEREQIAFFSFFDTAFFKEHVSIINRHLNFFFDPISKQNLDRAIKELQNVPLSISSYERYKLFLFLCQAEKYKENLPAIEKLFSIVLNLEVALRYVPHYITAPIYQSLGEGILGFTIGLNGNIQCEEDDLEAVIKLKDYADDYAYLNQLVSTVTAILNFFILSIRNITVKYVVLNDYGCILGKNRLGYDTNL